MTPKKDKSQHKDESFLRTYLKKTPPLPQKWGLFKLPNHATSWQPTRATVKG